MTRSVISIILALFLVIGIASNNTLMAATKTKQNKKPLTKQEQEAKKKETEAEKQKTVESNQKYQLQCADTDPLELVKDPNKYLNKYVFINGVFDKYTTLGLDYKPAMKSSKDYISFLIRRPDIKNKKHVIPLSELKLIISRKIAEKYTSLDTGDEVKIYGKVFSDALKDPWIEVNHVTSSAKDITAPPKETAPKEEMDD